MGQMGKVILLSAIASRKEFRAKADACRRMAERYYLDGDLENFAAWAAITRSWYKKAEELMEEGND